MSRTYTDLLLQGWEYVLAQSVTAHGLWVNGDVAYSRGPLFSPQVYRELYWPQHCRMRDWAHQRGMKFIYHTDGDVRLFLPMFIEAGFDCLQPLEAKANMDLRVLAPMYGNQISFFGNIDMMVALTNDRAAVESEVRSKLAAGMAGRNYAFHSDHSVPPQVSWATYQWIIELVDRYGWY
jgi:uroporphyrinogen decarboxylase